MVRYKRIFMALVTISLVVVFYAIQSKQNLAVNISKQKGIHVQKADGPWDKLLKLYQKKLEDLQKSNLWSTIPTAPPCKKEMHPSTMCTDPDCHQDIPENPEVRLQKLLGSMRSEDLKTVKRIKQLKELQVQHTGKQILFLTGSSSNHFSESQAMLKNFHETIPAAVSNYSLRYYDLGLTQAERAQANIAAADIVVWMDTSIRLPKEGLKNNLMEVPLQGLSISGAGGRAPTFIDQRMINYFNTTPCIYSEFTMVEANFLMFHNEEFVRDAIIAPWMACAVNRNCMCPDNSILYCNYSQNKYGICHRYDQAGISTIAMQLFGKHVESLRAKNLSYEIKRGDSYQYFQYLDSQLKQKGA